MAKRPEIFVVDGPLAGRSFEVGEAGLRLGRSSSNDLHIPDGELSRNHCLFEAVGEAGIRLTDLASANGTFLNGKALGDESAMLKEGDSILVGSTTIRVGASPKPPARVVDLGLDAPTAAAPMGGGERELRRRSVMLNVLWAVVALCAAAAIYLILTTPAGTQEVRPVVKEEAKPVVSEVRYEHVLADSSGIFRYFLTVAPDGVMTVRVDDVPAENRHHVKSVKLAKESLEDLNEMLDYGKLRQIDREYAGQEPDPPALESWDLKVVYDTNVRRIRIYNTEEPEAFRAIREKLEAFSKSELGVWAIQYPREKLVELARQSIEIGRAKWDDRDVNYGNLASAIAAFKEAQFYLETVNPKPECAADAVEGERKAAAELARRYADQRFRADKALNLSQWESARAELKVILEMVPDRRDDRNRDARSKLISAESHLKKKGGR